MGAQASPLTISIEGYGNDVFLFWVSDCANHEGQEGKYKFVKGIISITFLKKPYEYECGYSDLIRTHARTHACMHARTVFKILN